MEFLHHRSHRLVQEEFFEMFTSKNSHFINFKSILLNARVLHNFIFEKVKIVTEKMEKENLKFILKRI